MLNLVCSSQRDCLYVEFLMICAITDIGIKLTQH